jgi:hypothetical protein
LFTREGVSFDASASFSMATVNPRNMRNMVAAEVMNMTLRGNLPTAMAAQLAVRRPQQLLATLILVLA